jgi:heme iron utilization protein
MSELPQKLKSPIRETTPEAIKLAKTLIRTASFGSIAVLDPRDGRPYASRVSIATDFDGTPVTLISRLSFHTKSLLADPRCSLLLGEPGKGDPLAHPRISLACNAKFLERGTPEEQAAATRFIRRNPKSKLYAGFGDFSFARLEICAASLNGGFGQAFEIRQSELVSPLNESMHLAETKLIKDLNDTGAVLVAAFAKNAGLAGTGRISVVGCDVEGLDVVTAGKLARVWFTKPARTVENVYTELSGYPENIKN